VCTNKRKVTYEQQRTYNAKCGTDLDEQRKKPKLNDYTNNFALDQQRWYISNSGELKTKFSSAQENEIMKWKRTLNNKTGRNLGLNNGATTNRIELNRKNYSEQCLQWTIYDFEQLQKKYDKITIVVALL
jgi:hypothetical protein